MQAYSAITTELVVRTVFILYWCDVETKQSRLTSVYFDPTGFLLSFGVLLEMMTTWIVSSYNIYAFNILSICVCAIGLYTCLQL